MAYRPTLQWNQHIVPHNQTITIKHICYRICRMNGNGISTEPPMTQIHKNSWTKYQPMAVTSNMSGNTSDPRDKKQQDLPKMPTTEFRWKKSRLRNCWVHPCFPLLGPAEEQLECSLLYKCEVKWGRKLFHFFYCVVFRLTILMFLKKETSFLQWPTSFKKNIYGAEELRMKRQALKRGCFSAH